VIIVSRSFTVSEPTQPGYVRSPVTAIRLAGALVLLVITFAVLQATDPSRFAANLDELLVSAPHWLVSGVVAVCQILFLVPAVMGLLAQIALRRFMRVARMVLASLLAAALLFGLSRWAGGMRLPLLPPHRQVLVGSGLNPDTGLTDFGIGASFPTGLDLGIIGAWMFVDRGHWAARWRWFGRLILLLGVVAHVGVSLSNPAIVGTLLVAGLVASLMVQVAFGIRNSSPRAALVGEILQRLDHRVQSVERFGGFAGFAGFRVAMAGGEQLFVKIVNRDAWAALLPVRLYRSARFRDVAQDRPFRSLQSMVEHEALCALKAHSDGVPTARLAAVMEFPPDAMMMAFDARAFVPLREVPSEQRTPELLRKVWGIVAALQRSHIVHRQLNVDSLLVDERGEVVLVEFGSASLGVVGPTLSTDVAEVMAATAAMLGPEVAVREAVAGVGPDAVAAAVPRLQPLALSASTRSAVRSAGVLDALRAEVQRVTGQAAVAFDELERVKLRTIVSIAGLAVAIGLLIPQFLGIGSVWGELRTASWWWILATLALSVVTYLGAAIALAGSVAERLPFGPNVGVQMATSFVGVVAPGGALALVGRFLQKRGVDTATAVAAVGVDTLAGVIVHLVLTALFFALAGKSGLGTFDLPSVATVGFITLGVAVVAVVGIAVPWSRSLLTTTVLPATRRSIASVGDVARQPGKMIELFGGSAVITMGYVLALAASVEAVRPGPAFTSIALVYLVGSVVSSIAPTPGGIGAVEAALIAGLTSAGMSGASAVAAVILFRLATFWLPLLPGWVAFVLLQRSDDL
jgi:undecaprenyl-diphosphatase